MKRNNIILVVFSLISAVLLSIPWLVPHTGALALVGFVPLLCADAFASQLGKKFWPFALLSFVVWNTITTFWVCEATLGGGIFAIVANALQMLLIWMLFRLSSRILKGGALPYIFLAAMWLAWEKRYFDVEISWPWLTLGNAFADSTKSIQWYEYTGTLGGSLWIWMCNLGFFGLITVFLDGLYLRWNRIARITALLGLTLLVLAPLGFSKYLYDSRVERSEGSLDVIIAQPNFDPYQKFESMSQSEQNEVLGGLFEAELTRSKSSKVLLLAPETFTSDILLNDINSSPTVQKFSSLIAADSTRHTKLLLGASTYKFFATNAAPDILARKSHGGWMLSYNSALLMDSTMVDIHHKSKLVVGTEKTPYPRVFVPVDDWLSKKMGVGGLMGRCVEQDEAGVLHFDAQTPLGCAVCYESIYGEYCTQYVRKGAKFLTVITNDAWWGNTPGYRQHLNYSRLRAIETRRDVARCGNTGISCFINQKGDILSQTPWWERTSLAGSVNLSSEQTFFVRYGDIVGRVAIFVFLLLVGLTLVRAILPRK